MHKKIVSIIICIMFLICPVFMSGCGEAEDEISTTLTASNYNKFLAVNITYSNLDIIDVSDEDNIYRWYDKTCIGTITTNARLNCHYSNCEIEFSFSSTRSWDINPNKFKVNVSFYGNSTVSFVLTKEETILKTLLPSIDDLQISSIKGSIIYTT